MKPIVVVGSINMDLVSVVPRAPRPGETVFGDDFKMFSGGKGANQAVAVARLRYPSVLLGKVGSDIFGSQLLDQLSAEGIDTTHVERTSGSTGSASIVVDGGGENSIIVTRGANSDVTPEYLDAHADLLRGAGMVLTQLEIPLRTVCRLAELCEEYRVPLMLDPAPAQMLGVEILSRTTWFTPNETEAAFYTASAEGVDATVHTLLSSGVGGIILKRAEAGALIIWNNVRHAVKAFSVQAIDTVAAGDSFNGAFAVAIMRGMSLEESGRYAAGAAALSVTRRGAQASLPTSDELESFLSEQR